MGRIAEVQVQALDPARLGPLIGPERMARFEAAARAARQAVSGRAILNVNSTATGGGVSEMLQTLLAYVRGVGVDARWLVIEGNPEFFAVTKRLHNGLHGSPGDGGELGAAERARYEATLRGNADQLLAVVRRGDVVILHDPQPAGLAAGLRRAGALVVWRSHVGRDAPNAWTERAWAFLRTYLEDVDAYVVSRAAFAPPWADESRTWVIPPSIDPFSTKNAEMSPGEVRNALGYVGLVADGRQPGVPFV